ncbi:MAG TPA: LysR family transcriptional regulator [Candidatus Lachnoclostridium stercoravium]|uniref:LysR family transcriptional regulator n=1 Tax=Candidatus Lachnoclostridium stercoravium TaxID=2838633 RepID=A0A9D2KPV7_9FIRM|nr:LysR family transcriptional regulator [Candidatus Lachnoclostridium stercoravium]
MDTHYLNYILTIAEKRNMTKAAQELFVSQSSLSQYLSKLEQELGTPLFLRAKGELVPTAAGDLYISAAKQVISIKNQLYKDISALENKGNITIGTTSQFGLGIMAQVIPKFRIEYPDYTIEITESSNQALVKLLLDGQIDFGLMAANRIDVFPEGTAEVLREEELWLAVPASHPFCQNDPPATISHQAITEYFSEDNFILAKPGSTIRNLSDEIFQTYHFSPSASCETNNIPMALKMAASGAGIAFLAESCITLSLPLCYFRLDPPMHRLNVLARRKSLEIGPAEECFCSYIRSHFHR